MFERMHSEKDGYGALWAEFFISLLIAGVIKATVLSGAWMLVLLPITWVVVHYLFGEWIKKKSNEPLFTTKK